MTPAWLPDLFAAAMLVVAAVSAARVAAARQWRPGAVVTGTDVAHLLMAVAMAGMLAPRLRTLPDAGWEVIFGLLAAWFAVRVALDARANGVRALAGGHCAPHLVHSGAMLYMFLAVTAPAAGMNEGGRAWMPGSMMILQYPTLAIAFALVLAGYSVWDLDQLSGRSRLGAERVSLARAAAAGVPAAAVAELGPAPSGARSPAGAPDAGWPGTADSPAATDHGGAGGPASAAISGRAPAGAGALLLSPAVTVGGRVAMGVVMAFMLVTAA